MGNVGKRLTASFFLHKQLMKLTQKLLTGVGVAVLAVAASYPYVNAYVKSLPHKLSVEEARERYLKVVCPINVVNDQILAVEKKIKEEISIKYYAGSDELARANVRVGALENNHLSLAHRLKDAEVKSAQELTDPKYIWPESVRQDVVNVADENFRHAGWLSQRIKGADPEPMKLGGAASAVRRKLNLSVVGTGCPSQVTK